MSQPEPTTLRVNRARVAVRELVGRLERQGFRLEPVRGLPEFLRILSEPYPVSFTVEHWLGLVYVQQAATGVAAHALDPRPGERVLDLCAAPGGKTGHLAELMGGGGVLVAGDPSEKRLRGLLGNLYRLGHPDVVVVAADGRAFPDGALFDRVLVDAPCSAEGNARRQGGFTAPDAPFRARIQRTQRRLLRRALELTRPGGTVLYVTCTFAPEENEAVVATVLEEIAAEVEEIRIDVEHAPGLRSFHEDRYGPALARSWRLYPQHLDSGGLFLARLRRRGASADRTSDGWQAPPATYADDGREPGDPGPLLADARGRLEGELGVPERVLQGVRWMLRGDSLWLHRCDEWPVSSWRPQPGDPWRLIALGIRGFRPGPGGRLRPTNDLLRWLDGAIQGRVVDLDRARCLALLREGTTTVEGFTNGYVALRLEGSVVGRGWVGGGTLRSEIPKAHRKSLISCLEAGAR